MYYIDSHVHLDFYSNPTKVIAELRKANTIALFVTHLPELYLSYYKNRHMYPNCYIALGHHPNLLEEYKFQPKQFDQGLKTARFIGEVGLDYAATQSEAKKEYQRQVFDYICKSASDQVISVHTRKSEDDALNTLVKRGVKRAIFHWYTGKIGLIADIVQSGYYFSLNPMMLAGNKGKNIVSRIPIERVLIESDGPFSKYEGDMIYPKHMPSIYKRFADIFELTSEEFERIVCRNFENLQADGKRTDLKKNDICAL